MSQRRSGTSAEKSAVEVVNETLPSIPSSGELVGDSSLSLDEPVADSEVEPLAIENGGGDRRQIRLKNWKESQWAVGMTEPTWEDERARHLKKYTVAREPEMAREDIACVSCSAAVCPIFRAGRVGNMAVLHSTTEWVEEITEDEETGETTSKRYTRPRLNVVVGPYWPMLMFVTYPLIFGTSWFAFKNLMASRLNHPFLVLAWTVMTTTLVVALALTGCRDPGILYRHEQPPPQYENVWRWDDRGKFTNIFRVPQMPSKMVISNYVLKL